MSHSLVQNVLKTERRFIVIAFQLFSITRRSEGLRESERIGIQWTTSAPGLC